MSCYSVGIAKSVILVIKYSVLSENSKMIFQYQELILHDFPLAF